MKGEITKVTILGSTGSIGVNTLDVISQHPDRFSVFALSAKTSIDALESQCLKFSPEYAVVSSQSSADILRDRLKNRCSTEVIHGEEGLVFISSAEEVDTVMASIVGAAGLSSALAAALSGKRILLANKESLVMAGGLFMEAVQLNKAQLLPIDSEHNAIFQCLPPENSDGARLAGVVNVTLTASGGPFRDFTCEQIARATPEQACAHPNWSMGRKISVDSATLMNKGLELIEACWLFDLDLDQVKIVVHPQSIIHSMVQYSDGSVLAQLGNPDMRTPISYGLGWPDRLRSGVAPLDLISIARLDFEEPDEDRFPCLRLAKEAVQAGGTAMASCNAANEIAVEAFLARRIGFNHIPVVIEETLSRAEVMQPTSLQIVKESDLEARRIASDVLIDYVKKRKGT